MLDIVKAKKVTDISDKVAKVEIQKNILADVVAQLQAFQDAFNPRRRKLLEINALYRNKSYYDEKRIDWQTKSFIPLPYEAVEAKTSIIHQNIWGDKFTSPFTAIGATEEDQLYARSVEGLINQALIKAGLFRSSQKCARSISKNGKGVYRYGWSEKEEERLERSIKTNKEGEVERTEEGKPKYSFVRKKLTFKGPFVRNVDVVDHFFYDPNAEELTKYKSRYVGEIYKESKEEIEKKELRGEYDSGSYARLSEDDPHGINAWLDINSSQTELRTNDELSSQLEDKEVYEIIDYFGWAYIGDKDSAGNKKKSYVHIVIADRRVILKAEEWILGDPPFIDIPYVESLHSLNSTGVLDPAIELIYEINEYHNQRGDAIKFALNKQFAINTDMVIEDYDYVSEPGAMHPFATGERPVRDAIQAIDFNVPAFLSTQEENLDIEYFSRVTGHSDVNSALTSSNKDTPATTVVSLLNEQQSRSSMIINGILERHAELAKRVFYLIQLFGDEEFKIRTLGKQGLEIRNESLENILGEYDFTIVTSNFMGNKAVELQQMINYKQYAAQAPHIDQVEYDRVILEGLVPKKIDKILIAPEEPISAENEQLLFVYGQGEGIKVSEAESLEDLEVRIRKHERFKNSVSYTSLDASTVQEFEDYLVKLMIRRDRLVAEMQATQGGQGNSQGEDGNLLNQGNPVVRQLGNSVPFPGQQ